MNTEAILGKFDINPALGKQRAIQNIGDMIRTAIDPLAVANSVIIEFGGNEQLDFPTARITAKALVEQAVELGEQFDFDAAHKYAEEKVSKLRGSMPELFVPTEQEEKKATRVAAKKAVKEAKPPKNAGKRGRPGTKTANGDSLKERALAICEANSSLTNAQLAQLIKDEFKISYSNAYYYSSRCFKRK